MDLRQFSQTPTYDQSSASQQLPQQQQQPQPNNRRPSISSMSSASGYASSTYGGGNTSINAIHPNTTGNSLLSSRVNQSRHFGSSTGTPNTVSNGNNLLNNQNLAFNSTWLPQQNANSMLNVTPWIEQQAQVSPLVNSGSSPNVINMQTLSMSSMPNGGGLSPQEQNSFHLGSATRLDQDGKQDSRERLDIVSQTQQKDSASTINDADTIDNKIDDDDDDNNDNNNNNDNENDDDDDDDLIPTAIVIKNIPFAIKKEQLLDVMTKLNLPLPYAFNYHFDNGVFRGLAFANFTSTSETTLVVTQLNGREIGGRKLRVEYKKMLPVQERERIEREKREKRGQLEEQHRSTSATSLASLYSIASAPATGNNKLNSNGTGMSSNVAVNTIPTQLNTDRVYANLSGLSPPSNLDFNDPDTFELYSQFLLFREDKDRTHAELAYQSSLSANQRKVIPILASYLNLSDSYENGLIILRRKITNSPGQAFLQTHQSQQQQQQSQQHPLLRSQSHSSLGLLSAATQSLQNSRYRNTSGVQLPPLLNNLPQTQLSPQQQMKTNFMNKSSSNLASLRNPSALPLSQQPPPPPQPQQQQQQQQPSQPQVQQQQTQQQQRPLPLQNQYPPSNGYLSQSMLMSQGQGQFQQQQQPHLYQDPQHHHHHPQQQHQLHQPPLHQQQQQLQQPQQFGFPQHTQPKSYLDESLIASVENLTFN